MHPRAAPALRPGAGVAVTDAVVAPLERVAMRALTAGLAMLLVLAALFFGCMALAETRSVISALRHGSGGEALFSGIGALVFWLVVAGAVFGAVRFVQQTRTRR